MRRPHDPNRAEILAHYLDATEDVIRADLKDQRTAKNPDRQMDLTDALEALGPAREALADCPEGAELALRVLRVFLHRVRPAAALADLHYRAARTGNAVSRAGQPARLAARNDAIRAHAATLNPELGKTAKARILRAFWPKLSERTIRGLL